MNKALKKVVISFSLKKQIATRDLDALIQILKDCRCDIFSDKDLKGRFSDHVTEYISFLSRDVLYNEADVVIILGGDGSILSAARSVLSRGIPLLGINFGKIGYMAELNADQMFELAKILQGQYRIDARMMLGAEVIDATGRIKEKMTSLNEYALTNGPIARLLSFRMYLNEKLLEAIRSDGIVIATPTGSTAYSMSAGGPILDPGVKGILLTPICPYSLSSRPIVVSDDAIIEIKEIEGRGNQVFLASDGRHSVEIAPGDTIRIYKSSHVTQLIKTFEYGFVETLYRKLSDHIGQ